MPRRRSMNPEEHTLSVAVDIAADDIRRQIATRLSRFVNVFFVAPQTRSFFELSRLDVSIVWWDRVANEAERTDRAAAIIGVAENEAQGRAATSGGSIDVLFLPISDAPLIEALSRAYQLIHGPGRIAAFEQAPVGIPDLASVRSLDAADAVTTWHTTGGKYESATGLLQILDEITSEGFIRVRDSTFINPTHVSRVAVVGSQRRLAITLDDGSVIRVSQSCEGEIRRRLLRKS